MTKRNGVYFYEMWVKKAAKNKTTDNKVKEHSQSTDADGDVDMNKKLMQIQNKTIKEYSDRIMNLEAKIDRTMSGFTGLSLRS